MSIENGDILLSSGNVLFENGDIKTGDGTEQFIEANINASPGNFRYWPTLGANIVSFLNSPLNSRAIVNVVTNSFALDGFQLNDIELESTQESIAIKIVDAEKVTDQTEGLV